MVSKARDDLPDPDTPVITVMVFRGISRLMFFRLCSRAPRMTMYVLDMAVIVDSCSFALQSAPAATRRWGTPPPEPAAGLFGLRDEHQPTRLRTSSRKRATRSSSPRTSAAERPTAGP